MTEDSAELAGQIGRVNEQFYLGEPGDYFHVRLLSLLLMAGRPDEVTRLLAEGVSYAGVAAVVEEGEVDPDGVRDFVTIESQVLLHHAAETLVRLFLAHAGTPACPWLDLAGETSFQKFKERVRTDVAERPADELHVTVADVFLGRQQRPSDEVSDEQWRAAVTNLTAFVQVLAREWLDGARAYNSLKHGLAGVPGAAVARVDPGDGVGVDLGTGPSLAYVETDGWKDGRRSWFLTTRWPDVGRSLGLVAVAYQMIDNLWQVARARYLGAPIEDPMFVPCAVSPKDLRTPGAKDSRVRLPLRIDEVR